MAKGKLRTGACLCGETRIRANNSANAMGACHCSMCRQWGGGPLMALECGADVSFEGAENIGVFDSSEWAERGFCKRCGSHLFYRLKGTNQHYVPVGLFEDGNSLHFDHQVFIDEKPDYYQFANKTIEKTGAELFAQFAPPSD